MNMHIKYNVIERNQNRNTIKTFGQFDSFEEAKNQIEELFWIEYNNSDIPEHYSDYVKFENEKYVFTGNGYWEHDGRHYEIIEKDYTKEFLIEEVEKSSFPDFVEFYIFHYEKEYKIAANLHTDTIWMGECLDLVDFKNYKIDGKIKDYCIHELDREEYSRTILANSSTDIDDIWDESDANERAFIVRILIEN